MVMPRIIIAAPASGQGKTTASMGIMAALSRRGLKVQPYKVGPDYIDPAFHTAITGRSSINLDGWLLEEEYIKRMFNTYSADADISIIEGVMGLYDGFGDNPMSGSTAAMSKLLDAPTVLVMQAKGMAASAAAVVHGLKSFGGINIGAVIINKPSSSNHYNTVKAAIERHTGIKVIGYIPEVESIGLKSRHLGLIQSSETEDLVQIIENLAELLENNIDIEALLEISRGCSEIDGKPLEYPEHEERVSIAVAKDKAFSFYYHENLEILKRLGAELKYFSPLEDSQLPAGCCGLYIGGGYPEVFADKLEANIQIRKDILEKARAGFPIYAECGGYMYLTEGITNSEGKHHDFVGIFEGEAHMTAKLQNFGYGELSASVDTFMLSTGEAVRAHEFHKSIVARASEKYCIKAHKTRNGKTEEWYCGMYRDNILALYPHVYFPSNMNMAERFVKKCREYGKEEKRF